MSEQDAVHRFLAKHGNRAARTVNILAKNEGFKKALETDVGQEIFIDAMNRMEEILQKIIEEEQTQQELAEYRALRNIIGKWQDKLNDYSKALHKIANNKLGD